MLEIVAQLDITLFPIENSHSIVHYTLHISECFA